MSEYLKKFSNSCIVCNNNDFIEDEFGCLACSQCGSLSKNHLRVELDYEDQNKRMRNRMNKKNMNDEENDFEMEANNDYNNIEDEFTNCNTSLLRDCDSVSRISENNLKEKSINEIFQEHQELFIKLTKIFYISYKNLSYFKLNQFDTHEHIHIDSAQTNTSTLPLAYSFELNSLNLNHFSNNDTLFGQDFDHIFEVSKIIWSDLINKEYDTQTKKSNPMKRKFRSRKTTEDNREIMTKKEKHKNELNKRLIKEKNIIGIDDYKNSKLKKKEKIIKFIDEYDQVKKDFQNENFTYENVLKKCDTKRNITFEEAIHQYFTDKNLDYKMLHSEKKFDELKSNLNADNLLSLLNIIFTISNKNFFMKDYMYCFKRFDLMNSQLPIEISELKMMKYLNKEKFSRIIEKQRKIFNIKFCFKEFYTRTCNILELPESFASLCINLYAIIGNSVEKNISHLNTHENFMISVLIYVIKLLYGLNDLPYLIFLKKEDLNSAQINDPQTKDFIDSLQKGFELINIYGPKDSLFKVMKELPTLQNLLKTISLLIKKDRENTVLWESDDFKKQCNSQFKEKMKIFADKIWFNKLGSRSLLSRVDTLNKNNVHQQQTKNVQKLTTKVKMSNKFSEKLHTKNSLGELEINNFLKEELDFYDDLKNIYTKKNKKLEVPLPCDTIINYKKKAYKFEGVTPPESELMVYFFLKNYFKVDYQVLKTCNKFIEKFIMEKIK